MKTALKLYDSHLRNLHKTHPRDEPIFRAAIKAFDSIRAGEKATPKLLQPIVLAASDSRKMIFEVPVDFLRQLTGKHREAREAIAAMAEDKRSHVRFNAIMCIGKAAPKSFKLNLLRQGLRDKSSTVRQKAADWAGRQRLRELVPDLEQALAAETKAEAREAIEFELRLLRDGYVLETEKDGTVCVTTPARTGCSSRWFEQSEIDRRGIDAIVAEITTNPR